MESFSSKLFSDALAERGKTALPSLIFSNQTAYFNERFISVGGRLISNILEVSHLLKLKGLLLIVNIEKTFHSLNHNFLLKVLENYGHSQDFLKWISILLQNQESRVINGGKTTRFFPLKKGYTTRQPYFGLPFCSCHFY